MTVAQQYVAQRSAGRGAPSGLADVLDVLLDKGLVIDAFVRVSLVGIELLTIDARVVVAGVDTYLHFAEAVNRLDLLRQDSSQTVPELVTGNSPSRGRQVESRRDDEEPPGRDNHERDTHEQDTREPDGGDGGGGGKGLLSRLVDRGQAF